MAPYAQKINGWITQILPDGIICEDDLDGHTVVRDKKAFKEFSFLKDQYVEIYVQQITDKRYYESILASKEKTWKLKRGVMFVGVINTLSIYGSFDLKELDPNESPFKSVFFWAERSWLQNNRKLNQDFFPVSLGDVIQVEVKVIK